MDVADDDEGYRPKSRGSKSRAGADYSQPVAFVSGGTVQKEDDAEMKAVGACNLWALVVYLC